MRTVFLLFFGASAIIAALFGAAGTAVGTTDAFLAALFCLVDIGDCAADDNHQNGGNNNVCHEDHTFSFTAGASFLPESAYSALSFRSAFTQR